MFIVKDENNTRTNYPMRLPLYDNRNNTNTIFILLENLPKIFNTIHSVILNNEIHILGGGSDGYYLHYKWDGTSWVSVSTLPYSFDGYGAAVVLNNELHILGGDSNRINHYKWDGSTWTSVSTLPYRFYNSLAVVLNNEIHILSGDNSNVNTNHYKWNGSTWTSVSTLPYDCGKGSAVVFNNEIHILGGSGSSSYHKAHYKYSNGKWTSVSTLPYEFYSGCAVVYNNNIYIFGGAYNNIARRSYAKYSSIGNRWKKYEYGLPYNGIHNITYQTVIVLNDEFHIFGLDDYCITSLRRRRHHKMITSYLEINNNHYDKYIFKMTSKIPYGILFNRQNGFDSTVFNNRIHIFGNLCHGIFKNSKWRKFSPVLSKFNGCVEAIDDRIYIMGGGDNYLGFYYCDDSSSLINDINVDMPYPVALSTRSVVLNNTVHILGGDITGNNSKKHYKWWLGSWTSVSTLPYDFDKGSAVVLNGEIHILGGSGSSSYYKNHYKWDGTSWVSVSTLPYNFFGGAAVVLNNEIHILGSNSGNENPYKHYKWDGTSWVSVSTLPYEFRYGTAEVLNGEIHILGGYDTSTDQSKYSNNHYKFVNGEWITFTDYHYEPAEDAVLIQDDLSHKFLANPNGMKVKIKVMKQDTNGNYYLDEEMRTIKNMWIKTGPTTFKEFVLWDIPIPD